MIIRYKITVEGVFQSCVITLVTRWNFSVGNFELKLVPEMQSGMNFLEGEVGDAWRESQRIITDEPKDRKETENQQNQNQHLDLVIKVSVPDWKVMAFSTKPDGQLVWERQVRPHKVPEKPVFTSNLVSFTQSVFAVVYLSLWPSLWRLKKYINPSLVCDLCRAVLHTHRFGLAGGRG